jgi:MinD superfamily P-loop ATPase
MKDKLVELEELEIDAIVGMKQIANQELVRCDKCSEVCDPNDMHQTASGDFVCETCGD